MSEWRLLRQYVEENSEVAFSQLVDRHIKLVYWTCRRELGQPQLAEDATQEVFLLLARKAPALRQSVHLSGWLFHAARLVCRNVLRSEARRKRGEEEAGRNMELSSGQDQEWEQIEPWLNEALASLPSFDREAVLLRYFDGLSLREVAQETGTTENAAGKRVARAIEKLRRHFLARGAAVTSIALAALLAERPATAVPSTCKASALQAVHHLMAGHAAATAANSHATLLQKGAYLIVEMTKRKIAATMLAALLIGAAGTVTFMVLKQRAYPATFAEEVQWEQNRMNQQPVIAGVERGPFFMTGIDKQRRLFWMMRGVGAVTLTPPIGSDGQGHPNSTLQNVDLSSMPTKDYIAAGGLNYPAGTQVTDPQTLRNPQFAFIINGVTTFESGFGTHAIKDQSGHTIETIEAKPTP